MVVCPFRALVDLYWILAIFTLYYINKLWVTVSALNAYLKCFCPRTFFLKKWIGLVTTDLLYTNLHTKLRIISRGVSSLAIAAPPPTPTLTPTPHPHPTPHPPTPPPKPLYPPPPNPHLHPLVVFTGLRWATCLFPVWWANFRFIVLSDSSCVSLI